MPRRLAFYLFACTTSLTAIVSAAPAFAQDGAPQGASSATQAGLEDIIVTARRRSENIQSVPIAVTALGQELLQTRTVQTTLDLTNNVPGLRVSGEGSQYASTVSMRGLSRIANNPTSSAVMMYLNEVAIPGVGLRLPTFDLASVQVLKGPQGTLFGRNSIGGAILATSVQPSYNFTGFVKGEIGDLNYRAVEGAVNVPIIADKLAVRFAGQIRRRDGFERDLTSGQLANNVHQDSFRISVLFQPTDSIKSTTVYDWFKAREFGDATVLLKANDAIVNLYDGFLFPPGWGDAVRAAVAQQKILGARQFYGGLPHPFTKSFQWGITNTTTIDLGGPIVKNIIGFRRNRLANANGSDGMPPVVIDGRPQVILLPYSNIGDDEGFSEEIQLQGKTFDNRLDYTAGYYYYRTKPGGVRGVTFDAFDSSFTNPTMAPPQAVASYSYERSSAVYAQLSYKLTNSLSVTAGGRYTWIKVDGCGEGKTFTSFADYVTPGQCKAHGNTITTGTVGKPTWTFGLDYRISPDLFLYAVTRRGFREGDINKPRFNTPASSFLAPFQSHGPEKLTDIEIGAKTNYSLGRVRTLLNIAAFRSIYESIAQFANIGGAIPSTDPGYPFQGSFGYNGGKERIEGIEFDGTISPVPNLNFSFNGAYIHQKVLATTVPAVLAQHGIVPPTLNLATPKFSYTLAAQYTLPVHPLDGEVVLSADRYKTQSYEVQGSSVPGYEVSNLHVDWNDIGNTHLSLGFFMRNVFDKTYVAAPVIFLAAFPVNSGVYGEPRNYGVQATYRW
jgi:iron complex outermembrane receptor protein